MKKGPSNIKQAWKEDERLRRIRELQLRVLSHKGRVVYHLASLECLRGDYQR